MRLDRLDQKIKTAKILKHNLNCKLIDFEAIGEAMSPCDKMEYDQTYASYIETDKKIEELEKKRREALT